MSTPPRPAIGIFGAGKVGVAIARLALSAGYPVRIASSGSAAYTDQVTRYFAPGAVAVTAQDLPRLADILLIAVPLRRFRELPLAAMGGHIVIDVMNYWPPLDGVLPEFDNADRPSSMIVADALPATAHLVKTCNHLGYHQLQELPRPVESPERAALAVAGNNPGSVQAVGHLLDALGFDAVHAGALSDSRPLEPDSAIFGRHLNAHQLRGALGLDDQEQAA